MKPEHLRRIVNETTAIIGLYNPNATELLMLTAAQESHLGEYLYQIKGPALGIFQMEPATHESLWKNYLVRKPELVKKLTAFITTREHANLMLAGNIPYQAAMGRIFYYEKPGELPDGQDVVGMAKSWKKYWNTVHGKGTVEEAINNYNRYVKGLKNVTTSR